MTNVHEIYEAEYEAVEYDEMADRVNAEGGVWVTYAGVLRDAHGAGKLGARVRAAIVDELASRGLGVLPEFLPDRQFYPVRVYRKGSPIGHLIEAVLRPSAEGDEALRQHGSDPNAAIVDQIRQLVS